MRLIRVVPMIVALGTVTACGSSASLHSSPAAAGTPAATSTPTAAGSTAGSPSDDKSLAKDLVVHADDLPGKWKTLPSDNSVDPDARTLSACLGVPFMRFKDYTARVNASYARADNSQFVVSETDAVPTTDRAAADEAANEGPRGLACQTASAKRYGGKHNGLVWTFRSMQRLDVPGASYGFRATFGLTTSSGSTAATIDLLGFSAGRFEVAVNLVGVGVPAPADLEASLVGKVRHRAAAIAG